MHRFAVRPTSKASPRVMRATWEIMLHSAPAGTLQECMCAAHAQAKEIVNIGMNSY